MKNSSARGTITILKARQPSSARAIPSIVTTSPYWDKVLVVATAPRKNRTPPKSISRRPENEGLNSISASWFLRCQIKNNVITGIR